MAILRLNVRLFTVPYFYVKSSGSSAYRHGRLSWFHQWVPKGRTFRFIAVVEAAREKQRDFLASSQTIPHPYEDLTLIQESRP